MRTCQRPATRSASSCSSRAAPSQGGSPATSSRPAGSSHSNAPTGWRYCWISNTWARPATSRRATIETAPGWSTYSRLTWPASPRSTVSRRTSQTMPSNTTAESRTGRRSSRSIRSTPRTTPASRLIALRCSLHRYGFGISWPFDLDQPRGLVRVDCGSDQTGEERMRTGGPRQELRVSLRGDVIRMHVGRELDELDEAAVRRGAGEPEPCLLELGPVAIVDLIAVAVTLIDQQAAVGLGDDRAFDQLGRIGTQPHGAAKVSGAVDEGLLLLHGGDHRMGGPGIELAGGRVRDAEDIAGVLDHHALQPQAETQCRHTPDTGPRKRPEHALNSSNAEAAGDDDRVNTAKCLLGTGFGLALVTGHPADRDLGVVVETTSAHGLGHRQVGVRQVDVLAHQGDLDGVLGVVHPAQQLVPVTPVHVPEGQTEAPDDIGIKALGVQHPRDVVDARCVHASHARFGVDVAHQGDLALDAVRELTVSAKHDGVGLDTNLSKCCHRVLGRLGLQLTAGCQVGDQRDVQEEDVLAPHVMADLACSLQEGQRLDVADGSADLGDDNVRTVLGQDVGLLAHP